MILPGPLHLVRRKWARIIALQFGVLYPFTPKGSSRSAERGEEPRQVGDAPPCLPPARGRPGRWPPGRPPPPPQPPAPPAAPRAPRAAPASAAPAPDNTPS